VHVSNEARDIRIRETLAAFTVIRDLLGAPNGAMYECSFVSIADVAAKLTAIVMSENGENARHGDLTKTLYGLQNDLASRVDQIRSLFDSIAAHILDT
jgi:hypothetical protein